MLYTAVLLCVVAKHGMEMRSNMFEEMWRRILNLYPAITRPEGDSSKMRTISRKLPELQTGV